MCIATSAAKRLGKVFICCPNWVSALGRSHDDGLGALDPVGTQDFHPVAVLTSGSRIANTKCDLQIRSRDLAMLGELTNIPTDTLVDMLYIILAGEVAITAGDAAEIETIQRELQRRGGAQSWSFGSVN
jgi:hypothetical protein